MKKKHFKAANIKRNPKKEMENVSHLNMAFSMKNDAIWNV